jgi:hypothetical protein
MSNFIEDIASDQNFTDFRLPENRKDIFFTAYEFHLKFKTMPGLVYGYLPYLADKLDWSEEDKLWFAFLNGNTQNPSTSWIIFNKFPSITDLDIDEFESWYFSEINSNGKLVWQMLPIDMDRRHFRNKIHLSIKAYKENLNGKSQEDFFKSLTDTKDKFTNFRKLWNAVFKGEGINSKFYSFGRLSSFSYIEYLWISGLDIDCDSFFCEDYSGSSSHRNGMCWLMGREDLDEHKTNSEYTKGIHIHTKDVISMIDDGMEDIYQEALVRFKGTSIESDVSRFTIESQLCNYKSWHRKSRRYPNVYGDMAYDRLVKVQAMSEFEDMDFSIFWEARESFMPCEIRPECNTDNVGVSSYKQNLYRETGRQHTLGIIDNKYENVPKRR